MSPQLDLLPLYAEQRHYDALARRRARPLETIPSPPPSPPPCFECGGEGHDVHDAAEPCWACMGNRYEPGTNTPRRAAR